MNDSTQTSITGMDKMGDKYPLHNRIYSNGPSTDDPLLQIGCEGDVKSPGYCLLGFSTLFNLNQTGQTNNTPHPVSPAHRKTPSPPLSPPRPPPPPQPSPPPPPSLAQQSNTSYNHRQNNNEETQQEYHKTTANNTNNQTNINPPTGYLLLKLSDLRSILGQCVVTYRTCGKEGVRLEPKYKTCFASTLALKCDTCLK